MDRLNVVRVTLCATLAVLAACADTPSGPTLREVGARPSFRVGEGNPPPPPADGIDDIGGGGTGCVITPGGCPPTEVQEVTLLVLGVQATIFANGPGTNAFINFSSTNPNIVVSPDARVHETSNGLVGRGTITVSVSSFTGVSGSVGVIDLSTVTGTIMPATATGPQLASLQAEIAYPDGTQIVVPGVAIPFRWLRYAAFGYRY